MSKPWNEYFRAESADDDDLDLCDETGDNSVSDDAELLTSPLQDSGKSGVDSDQTHVKRLDGSPSAAADEVINIASDSEEEVDLQRRRKNKSSSTRLFGKSKSDKLENYSSSDEVDWSSVDLPKSKYSSKHSARVTAGNSDDDEVDSSSLGIPKLKSSAVHLHSWTKPEQRKTTKESTCSGTNSFSSSNSKNGGAEPEEDPLLPPYEDSDEEEAVELRKKFKKKMAVTGASASEKFSDKPSTSRQTPDKSAEEWTEIKADGLNDGLDEYVDEDSDSGRRSPSLISSPSDQWTNIPFKNLNDAQTRSHSSKPKKEAKSDPLLKELSSGLEGALTQKVGEDFESYLTRLSSSVFNQSTDGGVRASPGSSMSKPGGPTASTATASVPGNGNRAHVRRIDESPRSAGVGVTSPPSSIAVADEDLCHILEIFPDALSTFVKIKIGDTMKKYPLDKKSDALQEVAVYLSEHPYPKQTDSPRIVTFAPVTQLPSPSMYTNTAGGSGKPAPGGATSTSSKSKSDLELRRALEALKHRNRSNLKTCNKGTAEEMPRRSRVNPYPRTGSRNSAEELGNLLLSLVPETDKDKLMPILQAVQHRGVKKEGASSQRLSSATSSRLDPSDLVTDGPFSSSSLGTTTVTTRTQTSPVSSSTVSSSVTADLDKERQQTSRVTSSCMLQCDCCGTNQEHDKLVECCASHLLCVKCTEKAAKAVLSGEVKGEVQCAKSSCSSSIPKSELKKSLPGMIMELLEERWNQEALEALKNMEDAVKCPTCDYAEFMESGVKRFNCKKCKMAVCRYCLKDWVSVSHDFCVRGMVVPGQEGSTGMAPLVQPAHWADMPVTEQGFVAVDIDKREDEFQEISQLFNKTMSAAYIKGLYRIQNPRLWQKYSLMRTHMVEDLGEIHINERRLFHGTRTEVVEAICQEGFDWRLCGQNGTAFGHGSYFAVHASYSSGYSAGGHGGGRRSYPVFGPPGYSGSNLFGGGMPNYTGAVFGVHIPSGFSFGGQTASHSPFGGQGATGFSLAAPAPGVNPTFGQPNASGASGAFGIGPSQGLIMGCNPNSSFMFVARVLGGHYCQGNSSMKRPPKNEHDPQKRLYNSCVDKPHNPGVFVIFDSSQCYPEYLIEY